MFLIYGVLVLIKFEITHAHDILPAGILPGILEYQVMILLNTDYFSVHTAQK